MMHLALTVLLLVASTGCHGPRESETPVTIANRADVVTAEAQEPTPDNSNEPAVENGAESGASEPLGTSRPALGEKALAACVEPVRRAAELIEKGSHLEARPLLEGALEECPEYSAALYDLAVIDSREERFDDAANRLEQAIAANYLRYADQASRDPELEKLRETELWAGVEQRVQKLRTAWTKALDEPGAWLLLGHDVPMAMVYAGTPDNHQSWRGQLFYFHLPSKRFLPIGRSRQVSGFLVDPGGKRVHLAEVRRVVNLNCVSEDGGWCFQEIRGARISSLDLESLALSGPAKLPHRIVSPNSMKIAVGYPWPAITACEDRLLARYFLPPDPPRDLMVAELTGSETKAIGVSTFDEQGCTGPVLPLSPFRLARTHATSLKRSCLQLTPQHQLCSDRDASPVGLNAQSDALKVLLRHDGREEVLSDGAAVIQMETSAQALPLDPSEVEQRGLTCKSVGNPVRVAKISALGAMAVAASNNYLFIASRWWHIDVYDVSDPANPSFVGRIPVPGRAYNVHISGRYLIVGDGDGVHTIDIGNPLIESGYPRSPRIVKSIEFRHMGRRGAGSLLAVHGRKGYVIASKTEDYVADVHIIDFGDLENPTYVGKISDTHGAERVRLAGGRLYVMGSSTRAYELDDPLTPKLLEHPVRFPPRSYISGSSKVSVGLKRVETWDIGEADAPVKTGYLALGGQLADFAVEGRYAFIPGGPQGVHVVQLCEE